MSNPAVSEGPDGGTPDVVGERFGPTLENWKRKLLDLTKRNRALNFKPTRVSTVAIVDEQPAEVFRALYVRERTMRFKAAPDDCPDTGDTANEIVTSGDTNGDDLEPDLDESTALDFVPYDPATLGEQHTDEWLQTSLDPDRLDRSLRRIDEQARTTIEEQGVNTLFLALGMLHYRESTDSEVTLRAPLVLLPVVLNRTSARAGYSIAAGDEDAIVNPALVEYLRVAFGITVAELPDSASSTEAYDLQEFFSAVSGAVSNQTGWSVRTEVYLGLFSFQKFVMFKDLESNAQAIQAHRLVRQLLSRTGTPVIGLPSEIRSLELDSSFTPEATFQVVDADSSQMRAAAAVAKGYDIVIEGPPGTGKSQTITNLVAQALAAGKSVLFVAEKMAALSVVHRRLVAAGLGEFCFELHSGNANKRLVMKDLAAALDLSVQATAGTTTATDRLPLARATLNDYVRAVHEPFGTMRITPYRAYGELGLVLDAPKVGAELDVEALSRDQFQEAVRALEDLAVHSRHVGDPASHPWRDATRSLYIQDDVAEICELAAHIAQHAREISEQSTRASDRYGVAPLRTCADAAGLADARAVLADSPGAPVEVLQSELWNTPPRPAVDLVESGRRFSRMRVELEQALGTDVFECDHQEDILYVEQKARGVLGWLAVFDGKYRNIRKRWNGYRKTHARIPIHEQVDEMKAVQETRALEGRLRDDPQGLQLFGALWRGPQSDWSALHEYVQWVVRFRNAIATRRLGPQAAFVAGHCAPDVQPLCELETAIAALSAEMRHLEQLVGWRSEYLGPLDFDTIASRCEHLAAASAGAAAWAAFHDARVHAASTIARDIVQAADAGAVAYEAAPAAFRRAFFLLLVSRMLEARPPLKHFHTLSHEQRVDEFRRLDELVLRHNCAALIGVLRDRTQLQLQEGDAAKGLTQLRREIARQRGISPLRRIFRQCEATIRAIKPCVMMSPLTVAQYLDGTTPSFDLVIFDEASQLPTEDAVGAIIRGRQLVVVGDPKQLPPTNFFNISAAATQEPLGDDGSPLYEDTESVLEEFMGAAVPMSRLKWHYRSTHETLITFSNVSFYDADLHTFPSIDTGRAGLEFAFVAGGFYEGKGVNLIEARCVADAVVSFARQQLERASCGETPFSLGVGTFNLRQQLAIQDELEIRRREDPSIEPFFDRTSPEPFFVKNLENIQGDERDTIFLSVTYGKGSDGRLRYNFGPLNRDNGWRRLNVLTTRARHEMKVFSSIRGTDINPTTTTSDGPRLLRDFLQYAEHRRLDSPLLAGAADTESPFERDVYNELSRNGVKLVPQVGSSGYRIDLGVLDDESPGQFVCGIECDGVAYHALETARDRDRLRQQVLESRGWRICRVWSTDWFKDRRGQVERLLAFIKAAQTQSRAGHQERLRRATEVTDDPAPPSSGPPVPVAPASEAAPIAEAYSFAPGEGHYATSNLLGDPLDRLVKAVQQVVEAEAPLHEDDLVSRVAGMWSRKAGARIRDRILSAAQAAEHRGLICVRGQFYWRPDKRCVVRSRAGTHIPGNRIAPEEIDAAITALLMQGRSLARPALINNTRTVFGYSRTGPILDEAIGRVIDLMIERGTLGQGSSGFVLRVAQV